ncbi:uncharacterized protein LOC115232201 [Octopus sinensis]|uniref:Uncharacterized protein LOC115232201 n=1 Tax=Octopus sinensis TaxID=2607531 RepID=A0A6P7TZM4_9MOLL|nr:uncharacterized protein LOC115232201 [Octopus sinensis]
MGPHNATRANGVKEDLVGDAAKTNLHSLSAIIGNVNGVSEGEWVSQIALAAKQRLGRMPRGGWNLVLDKFNEKYSAKCSSLCQLKSMARRNNNVQGRCDSSRVQDDVDVEISSFRNCLEELKFQIGKVQSIQRDSRKPTPKVQRRMVKTDILAGLNSAIYHITKDDPPQDINQITDILYAVQCAYLALTTRARPQSTWLENTERKISKLADEIDTVRSFSKQTLPQAEKQKAMDVLCRYGYKKSKKGELTRIETLLNDLIRIKKKQISIHSSRKNFRKDNACFELNRRRFYRNLSSSNEATLYGFGDGECLSFWEDVWSKKNMGPVVYDFVGVRCTGGETMRPHFTSDFIMDMLKCAPDWKACGCDGTYNFFLKKMDSLHGFLCKEIVRIINGEYTPDSWFYTGVTYLIPKKSECETPKDLRPITCMPTLYKLVTKCVNAKLADFIEAFGLISDNQLGRGSNVKVPKSKPSLTNA